MAHYLLRSLVSPLVAVLLVACKGAGEAATETGSGPVRVATSISVFADMVRQVGGDRVTVISLIPPGADAHTFQPAPRDVKKLGDVRAVFINGYHLEERLMPVIEHNVPRGARIVELAAGLQAITFAQERVAPAANDGRGGEGEDEEHGNPHFWLDVQYARRYVAAIRDVLREVDPEGRPAYERNAERYLGELDELDREIRARIETIPPERRKLVTFHDAFPYFARAYGLELVGYVIRSPGRSPSAQEIKALSDTLRRESVPTVFKEPQLDAMLLERAAKDAGVRVDVLYSDALTKDIRGYADLMRRNADNIARGLQ